MKKSAGFTLLELLVVIVVIAIAAALVAPRLPASESMALQRSARSLAATLRYLGERSVAGKTPYRLHLNIATNSVRVNRRLPGGDEAPVQDGILNRDILEKGISLVDVNTSRLGKVTDGEVTMDFGAAGLTEFLTIHLAAGTNKSVTVTACPNNGRVSISEGYQESMI